MNGKDKCRILKEIRRQIARENDIALVIAECTHKGSCPGTCPRCEAEVAALERALEKRRALGRRIALAGISAGMTLALSGCAVVEQLAEAVKTGEPLSGNLEPQPTEEVEILDGEIEMLPEDWEDVEMIETTGVVPMELDGEDF